MLGGLDRLDGLDRSLPMVFYANHSNWWDGLVAFFLSREILKVEPFAMMEEKQLVKYRFFRWIGAFSVDRDSPRAAFQSVQYALSIFNKKNRALWIYPQGVMRANDMRPLGFQGGIARIADLPGGVQFIPVAHRYDFIMEQRPECFTAFGDVVRVTSGIKAREVVATLEGALTKTLDALRHSMIAGDWSGFVPVLAGRTSTNILYDRIRLRH